MTIPGTLKAGTTFFCWALVSEGTKKATTAVSATLKVEVGILSELLVPAEHGGESDHGSSSSDTPRGGR